MRKMAKGLLIGGAVGAGVAGVMAFRDEADTTPVGPRVAKAAAQAAALGAVIGWYLDRRDRARAARARKTGLSGALAGVGHAAESALPVIQHAADLAARRASGAAEAARPYVESAADTVRSRAGEAAEAARPYVESAAGSVRARAGEVADVARPHVESALQSARAWAPSAPLASLNAGEGTVIVAV